MISDQAFDGIVQIIIEGPGWKQGSCLVPDHQMTIFKYFQKSDPPGTRCRYKACDQFPLIHSHALKIDFLKSWILCAEHLDEILPEKPESSEEPAKRIDKEIPEFSHGVHLLT